MEQAPLGVAALVLEEMHEGASARGALSALK
jgi:hypothetical protein